MHALVGLDGVQRVHRRLMPLRVRLALHQTAVQHRLIVMVFRAR